MLSGQGYNQSFGPQSDLPYLAHTLRRQGELFPDYYGVAQSQLANGIALISGQGPTVQTQANCPAVHGHHAGEGGLHRSGARPRLRLPRHHPDPAGRADHRRAHLEGVRRRDRQRARGERQDLPPPGHQWRRCRSGAAAGRSVRDLAQSVRVLPVADAGQGVRRPGRQPAPACRQPQVGQDDPVAVLHRPDPVRGRQRHGLPTGEARRAGLDRRGDRGRHDRHDLHGHDVHQHDHGHAPTTTTTISTPTTSTPTTPPDADHADDDRSLAHHRPDLQAGNAATDSFLQTVVPEIEHSAGFKTQRPDRDHIRRGAADRTER